MSFDSRIIQLTASRICHDLAGTVSAVQGGLELFREETDPSAWPDKHGLDSLSLVEKATDELAWKLAFYRSAFGRERFDSPEACLKGEELARNFLKHNEISLYWPSQDISHLDPKYISSVMKLLLFLVFMGKIFLRYKKGVLRLEITKTPANELTILLHGSGQRLFIDSKLVAVFTEDTSTDQLTAHNIPFYLAKILLKSTKGYAQLTRQTAQDFSLRVLIP